ncbi:MAG: cupin-like domain-containing protein [Gammaproteobacteria bacterium]
MSAAVRAQELAAGQGTRPTRVMVDSKQILVYQGIPDAQTWERHQKELEPFVARDAFKPKVSIEGLRTLGEGAEVMVGNQLTGERSAALLPELIDFLYAEDAVWYVQQQAAPAKVAPLLPTVDHLVLKGVASPNIWLGGSGTVTNLHFDRRCNLIHVLEGEKAFTLFSWQDAAFLYPKDFANTDYGTYSKLGDIANVDRAAFPLFEKARRYDIHVGRGDILFLPPYWWHYVRGLSPCLMQNHWWPPSLRAVVSRGFGAAFDDKDTALSALTCDTVADDFSTDEELVRFLDGEGHTSLAAVALWKMSADLIYTLAERAGLPWQTEFKALCMVLLRSGALSRETIVLHTAISRCVRAAAGNLADSSHKKVSSVLVLELLGELLLRYQEHGIDSINSLCRSNHRVIQDGIANHHRLH